MSNLQLEIRRRFRWRVLRVHPVVLRILTAAVCGSREQMDISAAGSCTQMNVRFPLIHERFLQSHVEKFAALYG